ncbi:MerR family transcriptional regulator [Pseudomonas simiae]|jgi:DNA-binding transcriptional MerR regulator|uniref:MerR family transcriptional regulator n=1 Tax=Pseudomonas simiae TaxID=321846 RepID=A0A1N7UKR4_9PSED|nr:MULTISPECIES: MerR family transcriptional regulator [Pseudomonas]MBD8743313.1 MerR family transcriptional regulator [Pseudomonas fluorescens]PHX43295.1 MerR family transcriptional regulator [Pseudomonas sp. NZIPFR-PS2]AIB38488.1 MerR family transcriptional regulator [Pseudomonas simiae]KIQ10101.1 MerR family transcriptional regulator [Pseudomonas simiae]MBI6614976.1 MerR family transcriptional regulator [Pseudomonas simiae]
MPETIAPQRETTTDRTAVSDDLLPIREVARLTGVNPVTLRAWERRYGLIQPIRTESGHRLYSRTDIDTVHRILDWIERGVAVSKVGRILARGEPLREPGTVSEDGVEWAQWHGQLRNAISAFDDCQLDRLYGQIFSAYPLAVVFQDILMPLWQELLRHQGRFGQASEWLFFDNFLRSRTAQRLQVLAAAPLPRVLLAAIAGECRELEVLVAGLLLTGEKLAVKILGVGQPFDELTLVCEKTHPQALVLFSNRAPSNELPSRLKRLALTIDCPLLLAGDAADLVQERLAGSSIGCLGNDGPLMQRRLQQFLSGGLDT